MKAKKLRAEPSDPVCDVHSRPFAVGPWLHGVNKSGKIWIGWCATCLKWRVVRSQVKP